MKRAVPESRPRRTGGGAGRQRLLPELPGLAAPLLLALLMASAGCGPTQNQADGAGGEASSPDPVEPPRSRTPEHGSGTPVSGEVLLADPPVGWVESGTLTSPVLRMAEFVPAEEADRAASEPEAAVRDRVTFEAHAGQPLPDPIDFVLALSRDLAQRCTGFTEFNIMSGLENNYPTSVRLMICPRYRERQSGEVLMIKAIRGREYFYTVTRGRRLPAFAAEEQVLSPATMATWSTYLKAIGVCDPRSPEHACPAGIATEATDG